MVPPVGHNRFGGEGFLHFLIDVEDRQVFIDGVLQVGKVWKVDDYVGDPLWFVFLGGVFQEVFTWFGSCSVNLAGDFCVGVASLPQFGGEFLAGCFKFL